MTCADEKIQTIVKGADEEFTIQLFDGDGGVLDITDYDDITLRLCNEDDTFLDVTLVANANGSVLTKLTGALTVTISRLDTVNIKAGVRVSGEIVLLNTVSDKQKVAPLVEKFEVLNRLSCS